MRHRKALALVLIAAVLLSACTFGMNDGSVTIPETERPAPTSPIGSDGGSEPVPDTEPPMESEESPEESSVYYEGLESRDDASSGEESSPVMATPQPVQDVEIRELQDLKAGQCNDNLRFDEFQAFIREVYPDHTRLVEDRIVITVEREDRSPVHGAVIAIDDEQEAPAIRTGSDGKAYLFPGLLGMSSHRPIHVEVRCPEAVWGHSDAEGTLAQAQYGDEITVEMPCEPVEEVLLDVVYLHDVTGSMGDEMAQLQFSTERVMDMLEDEYGQSPGMIRVGGVLYRDRGDDFVTEVIDFDTPRRFSSVFQRFRADGGGDTPESVNAGLDDALQMAWREDAIKVIVLVGDAEPHDYRDDPWDRYLALSEIAAGAGVRIHTVSASGMGDRGEVAWREMALVTGGQFVFLTYEGGGSSAPGSETSHHVEGYNVSDLGSIVFSLLKQEVEHQR